MVKRKILLVLTDPPFPMGKVTSNDLLKTCEDKERTCIAL